MGDGWVGDGYRTPADDVVSPYLRRLHLRGQRHVRGGTWGAAIKRARRICDQVGGAWLRGAQPAAPTRRQCTGRARRRAAARVGAWAAKVASTSISQTCGAPPPLVCGALPMRREGWPPREARLLAARCHVRSRVVAGEMQQTLSLPRQTRGRARSRRRAGTRRTSASSTTSSASSAASPTNP